MRLGSSFGISRYISILIAIPILMPVLVQKLTDSGTSLFLFVARHSFNVAGEAFRHPFCPFIEYHSE